MFPEKTEHFKPLKDVEIWILFEIHSVVYNEKNGEQQDRCRSVLV